MAASLSFGAGCQASVEGKMNVGTKSEGEVADFDKPLEPTAASSAAAAATEPASAPIALLGARQDLTYHGPPTTACKCLGVALGQPGDPAFQWAGERPRTNASSQIVIALSSAGQACPEAGASPSGASYWGYETSGNDVVVVVEKAYAGRPLASGAIIPRPANGQVFVRPADKKLPYGRAASGPGERCQIGNLSPIAKPVSAPQTTPGGGMRIGAPPQESGPEETETSATSVP
jgi:hypothetical protein